jgi:CheY-like chemotaxis protein
MRTVIIDDEAHARHYLRELLGGEIDVEIVGEAASGMEGLDVIRKLPPDLVFLDIQMPGLDELQIIAQLEADKMPAFVFVTGYCEYAVQAFEVEAVDYRGRGRRLSLQALRQGTSFDFARTRHAAIKHAGRCLQWRIGWEELALTAGSQGGEWHFLCAGGTDSLD